MTRFRRILYLESEPCPSRRGLTRAEAIARAHSAELEVAAMAAVLPPEGGHGLRAIGHPDLILACTGSRPRPRGFRPDPADRTLLREAPCPTWLRHPLRATPPRLVIAALDLDDEESIPLARRVLETARSIADREGAAMHAVHAWVPVGEATLSSHMTGVPHRRVRRVLADIHEAKRARLERFVGEDESLLPDHLELITGKPARAVRVYARRVEADVVVVGETRSRGLARWVFGSVPERLTGRIQSSLLVVRSDGLDGFRDRSAATPGSAHPWEADSRPLDPSGRDPSDRRYEGEIA